MKVQELFNDAGKFPPEIGETSIFIKLQNGRLDPTSGSLALKNLQRTAKEGSTLSATMWSIQLAQTMISKQNLASYKLQGTRNNIFHLSNGDGQTMVELASPEHLDVLWCEVDKITSTLRKKKIDVLFVGPIPRFPTHCCTDPKHGLVDSKVNALTRFYRDLNTFVSRSSLSNQPRSALKGQWVKGSKGTMST